MVAQRQTDLDGSSNLYLLATGVQQDADGCHGFQINTSENCKTVHARNVNGKAYCLGTSIKKSSIHLQSHTFQFLLGNAETIPGQTRYIISPAGSGSTPGSLPSWPSQNTSKGTCPGCSTPQNYAWHPSLGEGSSFPLPSEVN